MADETGGELPELRDAVCGACGVVLMRDGEMTGTSFAVPAEGEVSDILCESCARVAGVWEDE